MLWTKRLVMVYMYLTSVGIVFISYWANVYTIKAVTLESATTPCILEDILSLNLIKILDPSSVGFIVLQNYILQCLLSFT